MSGDYSDALLKSLSTFQLDLIQRVSEGATYLGSPLYIVGGSVRDLLLGYPSSDLDLVVEGDAISLARYLKGKYGGKVTFHLKFCTAKWDIRGSKIPSQNPLTGVDEAHPTQNHLDLVSARSEIYKHPGALPSIKLGHIADDLRRRDFTINAIALRLDDRHFGELYDDFEGVPDLEKGVVRVLHSRSFIDDPTRMYRAVRYEQRLGFKIDHLTIDQIQEARSLVEKLSAQRIRHELDLILDETHAPRMLERLGDLDLLRPIHIDLPWDESIRDRFQASKRKPFSPPIHTGFPAGYDNHRMLGWLLWLLELTERQIESINKRLHFASTQKNVLVAATRLFASLRITSGWKPSKWVETLDDFPPLAVYAVFLAIKDKNTRGSLEKYLLDWRIIKPVTKGGDLKKLGIPPGPKYASLLKKLRDAWLDGEIHNEEEEKLYLKELLRRS